MERSSSLDSESESESDSDYELSFSSSIGFNASVFFFSAMSSLCFCNFCFFTLRKCNFQIKALIETTKMTIMFRMSREPVSPISTWPMFSRTFGSQTRFYSRTKLYWISTNTLSLAISNDFIPYVSKNSAWPK